jgi:hypothetical protein
VDLYDFIRRHSSALPNVEELHLLLRTPRTPWHHLQAHLSITEHDFLANLTSLQKLTCARVDVPRSELSHYAKDLHELRLLSVQAITFDDLIRISERCANLRLLHLSTEVNAVGNTSLLWPSDADSATVTFRNLREYTMHWTHEWPVRNIVARLRVPEYCHFSLESCPTT